MKINNAYRYELNLTLNNAYCLQNMQDARGLHLTGGCKRELIYTKKKKSPQMPSNNIAFSIA